MKTTKTGIPDYASVKLKEVKLSWAENVAWQTWREAEHIFQEAFLNLKEGDTAISFWGCKSEFLTLAIACKIKRAKLILLHPGLTEERAKFADKFPEDPVLTCEKLIEQWELEETVTLIRCSEDRLGETLRFSLKETKADLVFWDGNPENILNEISTMKQYLKEDAVVIFHDLHWVAGVTGPVFRMFLEEGCKGKGKHTSFTFRLGNPHSETKAWKWLTILSRVPGIVAGWGTMSISSVTPIWTWWRRQICLLLLAYCAYQSYVLVLK